MKAIDYENFWNTDNGITYCKECHIKNDINRGGV